MVKKIIESTTYELVMNSLNIANVVALLVRYIQEAQSYDTFYTWAITEFVVNVIYIGDLCARMWAFSKCLITNSSSCSRFTTNNSAISNRSSIYLRSRFYCLLSRLHRVRDQNNLTGHYPTSATNPGPATINLHLQHYY